MDRLLDEERAGPTYLRIAAVAQVVTGSIQNGAASDYPLHAWVVMPNHVHVLLTLRSEPSVALRKLKGSPAREANKLLGLLGSRFGRTKAMIG